MPRICQFFVCCSFVAVLAASSTADARHVRASDAAIQRQLKEIREDVAAVRRLRGRLSADLPKGQTALTLHLELPGFFQPGRFSPDWSGRFKWGFAGDLPVTLPAQGDKLRALPVPDLGKGQIRARFAPEGLRLTSTALQGTLLVRLEDAWSRTVRVEINAEIAGERLRGRYVVKSSAGDGPTRPASLSGRIERVQRPRVRAATAQVGVTAGLSEEQYAEAQALDTTSVRYYDDVRAILLARSGKMTYEHAAQYAASPEPAYPPLPKTNKSGKIKKKDALPDLDDAMSGVDLGGMDVSIGQPTPKADKKIREALQRNIAAIAERVAARRRVLEDLVRAPGDGPAVVTGSQDVGDAGFGPWYGEQALPTKGDRPNVISADAGKSGSPAWPFVDGWTTLGPVRTPAPGCENARLPDLVPGRQLAAAWHKEFKHPRLADEDLQVKAEPGQMEAGTGYCRLPLATTYEDHGPKRITFPFSSMYAWTTVHAEMEKELWIGVTVNERGSLWINDRLVWRSTPGRPARRMEETGILKVRFRRGTNRLLIRNDNLKGDGYFSVRVCVRGQPRSADQVAAAARAQEQAASPFDGTRGWRGDFRGRHGDTTAPVVWDPHEKINVRWIREMDFSYASPVVMGDRLITMAEPHTVICVDKRNGKEIWRRHCDISALRGADVKAEAERLRRNADTEEGAEAYERFLRRRADVPAMGWYKDVGHTFPTPVTDGEFVYVKINTGALASYDADGNRRWLVDHGLATTDCGAACPSPLLVAGRLIVFGPAEQNIKARTNEYLLKAYDPATGRLLWKTATLLGGQICGTPTALRLSNGGQTVDVIVTANGTIVRAEDGKTLRTFVGVREVYGSPASDGALFTISEKDAKSLFELIMVDRDTIGVKRRWYVDHLGHFQDGNYGAFSDGKLYFSRPLLDVTDVAGGELRYVSDNTFFCRPGRGYPPIALAGGRLYTADNATWFQPKYRPYLKKYAAAMPVLTQDSPPMLLGCSFIDRISGGFTFDDGCLYIRGSKSLMCIGYTGADGLAWEARRVAGELLSQFFSDKPKAGKAVPVQATKASGKGQWEISNTPGGLMRDWIAIGPLPAEAEADVMKQIDSQWEDLRRGKAKALRVGGRSVPVQVLGEGNYSKWAEDEPFGVLSRENFRKGPHIGWHDLLGRRVDLFKAFPPQPGHIGILACVLHNDRARTFRFDGRLPGITARIGGTKVKHNECVALSAGAVPMVLTVQLDGHGDAQTLFVRPQFLWQSNGYEADIARWRYQLERRRPWLKKAARLAPDTEIGRRAQEVLAQ